MFLNPFLEVRPHKGKKQLEKARHFFTAGDFLSRRKYGPSHLDETSTRTFPRCSQGWSKDKGKSFSESEQDHELCDSNTDGPDGGYPP